MWARRCHTRGVGIDALLLAPGAGAGRDQRGLVAIDDAATSLGIHVQRFDFPYRLAGRRAPDRLPVLTAALADAARALAVDAGASSDHVALGGRSMGGRVASVAVAGGLAAAGLVLVSYPLHPPGRPEKRRVEHFGTIRVPCLFVSGSRDAFATPEELERETAAIPGEVTVLILDGGDHGLARREELAAAAVADWLRARR